jgi:hypothetical protein
MTLKKVAGTPLSGECQAHLVSPTIPSLQLASEESGARILDPRFAIV